MASDLSPKLQRIAATLDEKRAALLEGVAGLSEAQLVQRPAEGQWSVGEVLDHLYRIEQSVARLFEKLVARAREKGLAADEAPDAVVTFDQFEARVTGRKLVAPEGMQPAAGLDSTALHQNLRDSRVRLLEAVAEAAPFDLSGLVFPHPILGRLNLYEWLLFVAYHEAHHLRQIQHIRQVLSSGAG